VTLAIFSILGVAIIDVFLLALHAQRQTSQRQKTLASLRYVTETIARQIRTSEIDYATPYSPTGSNILVLNDLDDNKYEYKLDTTNQRIDFTFNGSETSPLTNPDEIKVIKLFFYVNPLTNPFLEERCNDALGGENGCLNPPAPSTPACTVTDEDAGVMERKEKLGFCLCDSNDDNCASKNCGTTPDLEQTVCLPFDFQPRVTIVLGFQSVGLKPEEQKTIYLQTTVSSRVYKR
jgi:type II secretory pathway pseudopilin PulG